MNRHLLPLALFAALALLLGIGLALDPRELRSPLVGRAVPPFEAVSLHPPARTVSPADLRGQVWVLNVWASWCTACGDEHALLLDYAGSGGAVPLVGLNYKDRPADARAWLERLGDPYRLSVSDPDGRIGLDFGVYGVPETYVIDRGGVIRFKQAGPLTPELLRERLLPLIRELQG